MKKKISTSITLLLLTITVIAQNEYKKETTVYSKGIHYNNVMSKYDDFGDWQFATMSDTFVLTNIDDKTMIPVNHQVHFLESMFFKSRRHYETSNTVEGLRSRINMSLILPISVNGMLVDNSNHKIFKVNKSVWLDYDVVYQKLMDAPIKSHKYFKKVELTKENIWISNFYNDKAIIAYIKTIDLQKGNEIIVIGSISKDKKMTFLSDPHLMKGEILGFTRDGYFVNRLEDGKREVYDSNLKELDDKTFIKELDIPSGYQKAKDEAKYMGPVIKDKHIKVTLPLRINTILENEKYILVTRYDKKAKKVDKSSYNYMNRDGEFLFDEWFLEHHRFEQNFKNGHLTLKKGDSWVEMNTSGEITHKFDKSVIAATVFRFGKSIIQTVDGVSLINRQGEVLYPFNNELSIIRFGCMTNCFFNINGKAPLSIGESPVLIDTNFNIAHTYPAKGYFQYLNDYDDRFFERVIFEDVMVKIPNYNKELPPESIRIYGFEDKKVTVYSAFIPSVDGTLIPDNRSESFYVTNYEDKPVTVSLTFTYNTYSNGAYVSSSYKNTATYSVTVPSGEIRVIRPALGKVLRTYKTRLKQRQAKISYSVK